MSRGHVELVHAPEIAERELPALGWPREAGARVLSADEETEALTAILRLPAGWRRRVGHIAAETEWLLLEGSLQVGETLRGFGYYQYDPAGATHEPWETDTGATLLLFARDGRPDFKPGPGPDGVTGRIELDTEAMPWQVSPIPGPPEGNLLKILRHVEATGEMSVLCSSTPQWDHPRLEFHDCAEEIYLIEGDHWLGNSGTMTDGSYLWRPPFVTHGPFYSRDGGLMFVHTPSALVNHMPEHAGCTPAQNLAAFVAAGGQRVLPAGVG